MKSRKSFISTQELADLAEVSHPTIFRAVLAKKILAFQTPGGRYRIKREDAEKYLKKLGIEVKI